MNAQFNEMVPNWVIVWLNKLHMKPVCVFAYFNTGLDKWLRLDETCEEAEPNTASLRDGPLPEHTLKDR